MPVKIDVFNHIFPKPFFERLQRVMVNPGAIKRRLNIPFLHDLDTRCRQLEEFGPDRAARCPSARPST
jgi:aminocarboxymuconate-semialdehyde decarboxylase